MKKTITTFSTCLFMTGLSQAVTLNIPPGGSVSASSNTLVATTQAFNGATFDIVYTLGARHNDTTSTDVDGVVTTTPVDPFINSDGTQVGIGTAATTGQRNGTIDGDTGEGISFTNLSISNFQANGSGLLQSDITDLRFTMFSLNNAGNGQDGINVTFGTVAAPGDFNATFGNDGLNINSGDLDQTFDVSTFDGFPTDLVTGLYITADSNQSNNRVGFTGLEVAFSIPEPSSTTLLGVGLAGLLLRRRRA